MLGVNRGANEMQVQVNASDYEGIQIEAFDGRGFSVPAWDERGLPALVGDVPDYTECGDKRYVIGHHWSSVEAAQRALHSVRDLL